MDTNLRVGDLPLSDWCLVFKWFTASSIFRCLLLTSPWLQLPVFKGIQLPNHMDRCIGVDDMTPLLLSPPTAPSQRRNKCNDELSWQLVTRRFRIFQQMTLPYFRESMHGCWLLLGLLALALAQAGVTVKISYLNKDFYNVLVAREVAKFYVVLVKYLAAFLVGSPITVLYNYQRDQLAVHWREWMTTRTFGLYVANRAYYNIERNGNIDNPDQRISEDIKSFTSYSLELGITCLTSFIDLLSFSAILWTIYPQLFAVTLAYAGIGTFLTAYFGRSLYHLNFAQLNKEADLRYALVRLRENCESIAFYAGEALEGDLVNQRVTGVMNNRRSINQAQRNLEFFTVIYGYMVQILPVAVVAPKYFAGDIAFGAVSQAISAFNHIVKDLCIIINQFEQLSAFSAGLERLGSFFQAMETDLTDEQAPPPDHDLDGQSLAERLLSQTEKTITMTRFSKDQGQCLLLKMQDLTLKTPDCKRTLISNLSMSLREGEDLLIVGSSGTGKSSLLRAIAGLWSAGYGAIERPIDEEVYFLPQRPYCTLGSLRDQLLYPSLDHERDMGENEEQEEQNPPPQLHTLKERFADDHLLEILEKVDLIDVAKRAGDGDAKKGLRVTLDWSNMLSLGEQQRLAFGRLLVNQPRLVVLDEATSALDTVSEDRMYKLLQDLSLHEGSTGGHSQSASLTYISVGHRPSLLRHHDLRLHLKSDQGHKLDKIDKASSDPMHSW